MNRRIFLGLVGGTIAAAATPEAFHALVVEVSPAVAPFLTRYVSDVTFTCTETGIYTIGRADGMDLVSTGMHTGGIFRWAAPPGWEIVLPPNMPALVIAGPGVEQWSMMWTERHDDGRHRYLTDSRGNDRVSLTIGDTPIEVHNWLTHTDQARLEAEWYGEIEPDDYDLGGD